MKKAISAEDHGDELMSDEEISTYHASDSSDSDSEAAKSDSDSSSDEDEDDETTLVVDLGSHRIKGGYAGDDAPRAIFRFAIFYTGSIYMDFFKSAFCQKPWGQAPLCGETLKCGLLCKLLCRLSCILYGGCVVVPLV